MLILGGSLACFAGHRLFKLVLAMYGFIFGALLASSTMGVTNTAGMVGAALLGGIVGALILVFAYFVGIALVGAGLGALVAHVGWTTLRAGAGDPPVALVIVLAICGSIAAMVLQRWVIVVTTAVAGAWTIIVGALAIAGDRLASRAATTGDVWILYPLSPTPPRPWVPYAWVALGFLGMAMQLGVTGRRR